ncbi:unnamed protein product [Acanthoscelides obtectus]|uniref:HTH psq-type domain-containing protein n=1 Tax=Acanthoscelides obtectus TaxID=200917 RepID=A0A9P0JRM7_ACAOB|nr:unnamed protein product [Acanthoscelides obtectus]CAK1654384.1 hypothetical protein AOBTE_LOCUS18554 [Acanthoscelides obtectus]
MNIDRTAILTTVKTSSVAALGNATHTSRVSLLFWIKPSEVDPPREREQHDRNINHGHVCRSLCDGVVCVPSKQPANRDQLSGVRVLSRKVLRFLNMVRTYKKKTARGIIPIEQYESAMQAILHEKISIRDAATRYGVNFMTLHRYMKKKLALNVENRSKCLVGYATHRKIFNDAEEQELAKYTEGGRKDKTKKKKMWEQLKETYQVN